jgi:hypothetical protein
MKKPTSSRSMNLELGQASVVAGLMPLHRQRRTYDPRARIGSLNMRATGRTLKAPRDDRGAIPLRRVPNAVANLAPTRAAGTMPMTISTMNGARAFRDLPRPRPVIRSLTPMAGGTTPPGARLRGPPRNPAACRILGTTGRLSRPDVSQSPQPYRI